MIFDIDFCGARSVSLHQHETFMTALARCTSEDGLDGQHLQSTLGQRKSIYF